MAKCSAHDHENGIGCDCKGFSSEPHRIMICYWCGHSIEFHKDVSAKFIR